MVARAKPKRMYRTMQGRMVDIEKIRAANESVQAVGNMNVNARGDVLGAGGKIVTPKSEVIKQYYEKPKGMVDDTPARSKPTPAPKVEAKPQVQKMTPVASKPVASKPAPQKAVAPKVEAKPVETFKPKTESSSKKGIDAALDGLE
jgi:outer membrane biosynthesis protein TonB